MCRSLCFIIGLSFFFSLKAQIAPVSFENDELSLKTRFDSIMAFFEDSLKTDGMTKLTSDLAGILANAGSFDYPFDSLKLIGKIKSPDNAFRIFTWNIF
ncbi:MAG: hypothetical protein HC905_23040 [Bacteroidales bacterium]|nr:hypothetical protein [Bacteroidales bacterium]